MLAQYVLSIRMHLIKLELLLLSSVVAAAFRLVVGTSNGECVRIAAGDYGGVAAESMEDQTMPLWA